MASVSDRDLQVARIYSRALVSLAASQGAAEELLDELAGVVALLDRDPELESFLSSPLVEQQARAEVIEKVFRGRASDLLVDGLQVINRKGRAGLLRAIAEGYRIEYRELRGLVAACVTTAVPLSPELRRRLTAALADFTGKQPDLEEKLDGAVLGGVVVEVAGKKFDSSVASRLAGLSALLAERAAHGLPHDIAAE
jgi:F-type H+-transporting ATPase subunit delta